MHNHFVNCSEHIQILLAECVGSSEHCIGTVSSESGRRLLLLLHCWSGAGKSFFCEKCLFVSPALSLCSLLDKLVPKTMLRWSLLVYFHTVPWHLKHSFKLCKCSISLGGFKELEVICTILTVVLSGCKVLDQIKFLVLQTKGKGGLLGGKANKKNRQL